MSEFSRSPATRACFLCLSLLVPVQSSLASDTIILTATQGSGSQQIRLDWTGSHAPYAIFRATTPSALVAPANKLGELQRNSWIDESSSPVATFFTVEPAGPIVKNVRDFGATGDGVSNDTAAIQSAIDAHGPATVYFPPGKYRISSQLSVPTAHHVVGDSCGASVILNTTTSGPAIRAGGTHVVIKHLDLTGGQDGILGQTTSDLLIEGCCVHDTTGRGITIQDSTEFTVSNCKIQNVSLQGIDIVFSTKGTVSGCDVRTLPQRTFG